MKVSAVKTAAQSNDQQQQQQSQQQQNGNKKKVNISKFAEHMILLKRMSLRRTVIKCAYVDFLVRKSNKIK